MKYHATWNYTKTYHVIKEKLNERGILIKNLCHELNVKRQHLHKVISLQRESHRIARYICHRLNLPESIFPYLEIKGKNKSINRKNSKNSLMSKVLPVKIGYLKNGEAVYKTEDGFGIEKDYDRLVEPTEKELKEIFALYKN
jgi:hypothetical protein